MVGRKRGRRGRNRLPEWIIMSFSGALFSLVFKMALMHLMFPGFGCIS